MQESTPYLRTRRAVWAGAQELKRAHQSGELAIPERERPWLERLEEQAESLPDSEERFCEEMADSSLAGKFLPDQYGFDKWTGPTPLI